MEDFELIPEELDAYARAHTSPVDPLLEELDRDTHVNVLCPRMLSGAYQGKLLEMLSRMIRPARILEVGTYTGYATICLSKGLGPEGRIVTIEHDPELRSRIVRYLQKAGLEEKTDLQIGEALDLLPLMEENSFDLIFLDADKENYLAYYPLLKRLMRPQGWLLIDNVLWSGKVYDPRCRDRDTKVLRELNLRIQNDREVENILLPLRDGITIIRKR